MLSYLMKDKKTIAVAGTHGKTTVTAMLAAIFIKAEKDAVSEKPIHIVHISTGKETISQPHHILIAEKNSRLEVVQTFISQGETQSFTNSLTEVTVNQNAEVRLDKTQSIGAEDHHLAIECVKQEKDSRFSINSMQFRGGWIRNNLNISSGEHCTTDLFGAYMPDGKEHVDNHTRVDHTLPHSESNELYKGIAKGKGTGVFNGKVYVHPHAQLTNAFQSNGNILMSDDATIHSKPELEIYADDVQCSHGSTTGQFDEEAVYYLRARGLSEESARKMLTSAFLSEAFENISNDALRVFVEEAFAAKNS
jgi:Fe-S cluster assembly protein SufD